MKHIKIYEDYVKKNIKYIGYHGSNYSNLTKDTIKINTKSEEMFYGLAFYVASNKDLAKKHGKYIYKIEYFGNFFKVIMREVMGTWGTFEQYKESIYNSYVENILDNIKEDPKFWKEKLKLSTEEIKEMYSSEDNHGLAQRYIDVYEKDLFKEYLENQINLSEEYIKKGYDGIADDVQTAIFNPEKNILSIKKLL